MGLMCLIKLYIRQCTKLLSFKTSLLLKKMSNKVSVFVTFNIFLVVCTQNTMIRTVHAKSKVSAPKLEISSFSTQKKKKNIYLWFLLLFFFSFFFLKVHIVYMGEKHHHDPEVVTSLHHDMLASVFGRYSSCKPVINYISSNLEPLSILGREASLKRKSYKKKP